MQADKTLALFEEIMLPHLNAAYELSRWLTRNEHDAEDIVQEAYLRALRFFDGYHGGDPRAWLLTIVRNTCRTRFRQGRHADVSEPFDEHLHAVSTDVPDSERALITEASIASLRECIEALPEDFREVIVMRELEDLPYKEIAEATAVPIGTVMSRLARARKRLQQCLGARK